MSNDYLFALIQHPMILIVNEDRGKPEVGERVPDWGAPDIKAYSERIRHNLKALGNHPDLMMNYEFSAMELKILDEQTDDIIPAMRELVAEGRLSFVGGDYSQAHGQLYSGELNYRQLEKGLEIFNDLVGYRVTNNFHQETCLHDQMPQLLAAFGFLTASPPVFPHTVEPVASLVPPHFVYSDKTGYVLLASDSVALWEGLDGTEIPVVLTGVSAGGFNTDRILMEDQKGLYRSSRILITAPDMEEISEERYRFIKTMGKTILLDNALLDAVSRQKPTWKLKLGTYWSYSEGQFAEEVYRKIREAENMLLAEETQTAVLKAKNRENFSTDWEIVLAAMHHDIHWIEVTDLKAKYAAKLDEVIKRSKHHLAGLFNGDLDILCNNPIRVVNTLSIDRKETVRFTISGLSSVKVFDSEMTEIPAMCIPSWEDRSFTDVFFTACVPAMGTKDYTIIKDDKGLTIGKECDEAKLQAGQGVFVIKNNGTVSDALIGDQHILKGPGHDLRYLDKDGGIVGGISRPGTMIHFKGFNLDVLRITAPVGNIPVEIEYVACPDNRFLLISTRFHFDSNEIGTMWEDWTKLNSYWYVAGNRIRHDIPYGVSDGLENVPLYAPNWISVKGEYNGLAVMNKGTPKHFVNNGVIGCVWAWGGHIFSNRMHLSWLKKNEYDLSLKGMQTIVSGVIALNPMFSEADIAETAQCFNTPMFTFRIAENAKSMLRNRMPDFSETGLIITSVQRKDDQIICRYYEAEGKSHGVSRLKENMGCIILVTDLKGNALDEITPYRIGYIYL